MSAMKLLCKRLDTSGHLLEKLMLLLDDILKCIDLLIQLALNINGAPFFLFAHSVKSVVFLQGFVRICGLAHGNGSSIVQRVPRRCAPHRAASPTAIGSIYMFACFMIIGI